MSEYVEIKTEFKDRECLVRALNDLGFAEVEVGQDLHLYGYQGDRRPQTAGVVVRRQFLGGMANDLGFRRTAGGSYEMIVSEYDRTATMPEARRKLLTQRYTRHVFAHRFARARGARVQEKSVGGKIRLKITLPD